MRTMSRAISALCIVGTLGSPSRGGGPEQLFPNALFRAQQNTQQFIPCDIDHDGDIDIVDVTGSGVALILGLGNGTFAPPTLLADSPNDSGFKPNSIVIDFNGDGALDIATPIQSTAFHGSFILVYLATAPGVFSTALELPLATSPAWLRAADLNRDGAPDLVTWTGSNLILMFNDGNGAFGAPIVHALPNTIADALPIDADADGDADLAVAFTNGAPGLAIYQLDAAGLPLNPPQSISSEFFLRLRVIDANHDAFPDLAAARTGPSSAISVFLNNAGAGFQYTTVLPVAAPIQEIAVVDFDADANVDLAIRTGSSIEVFRNLGAGAFIWNHRVTCWSTPTMAFGDFNGNGLADVIVGIGPGSAAGGSASLAINWNLGTRYGRFIGEPTCRANGDELFAVDLEGDGNMDIVGYNNSPTSTSGDLIVRRGLGDGTFPPCETFIVSYYVSGLAMGDLDGDGDPDAAIIRDVGDDPNPYKLFTVTNVAGSYLAPVFVGDTTEQNRFRCLALADIDGDSDLDAVLGMQNGIGIFRNNGDATFAPIEFFAAPWTQEIAIGDLDGDGDADIVGRYTDLRIYTNDGTGQFTPAATVASTLSTLSGQLRLADWDNDGDLDIFSRGASTVVLTFRNNGGLSFTPWTAWTVPTPLQGNEPLNNYHIGDVDGDTYLDVVVADSFDGQIHMLRGNGTSAPTAYSFGALSIYYGAYRNVVIADFDNDGRNDVSTGSLSVLIQNTPITLPTLGACCAPSGVCLDGVSGYECTEVGGLFLGPTSTCLSVDCELPPPPLGACCLGISQCVQVSEQDCALALGTYHGDGLSCSLGPCDPTGACCLEAYVCAELAAVQCVASAGSYHGDDTTCEFVPCDPTNACCIGPFQCEVLSQTQCTSAGGEYLGGTANCSTGPCDPVGACCVDIGQCALVTQAQCEAAEGTYLGDATSCTAGICDLPTGRCCFACAPSGPASPCPDLTTYPSSFCLQISQDQCASTRGVYSGDGTACTSGPCSCAADMNGDLRTTAEDFIVLASHFGMGGPDCMTRAQGDLNCDGAVTIADFLILAGDFGCGN